MFIFNQIYDVPIWSLGELMTAEIIPKKKEGGGEDGEGGGLRT